MSQITDPSSSTGHRSAGLLLVVLLAGCAALVIAGHGPSSACRESRAAAAWQLGSWVHNASDPSIAREAGAEGGLKPFAASGASVDRSKRLHREHGFGFAIASRTLSRSVNLPPPSC